MAQLHIIYDELEPPLQCFPGGGPQTVRIAQLPLADGLKDKDLYDVARRLAELLLEQIEGDE